MDIKMLKIVCSFKGIKELIDIDNERIEALEDEIQNLKDEILILKINLQTR